MAHSRLMFGVFREVLVIAMFVLSACRCGASDSNFSDIFTVDEHRQVTKGKSMKYSLRYIPNDWELIVWNNPNTVYEKHLSLRSRPLMCDLDAFIFVDPKVKQISYEEFQTLCAREYIEEGETLLSSKEQHINDIPFYVFEKQMSNHDARIRSYMYYSPSGLIEIAFRIIGTEYNPDNQIDNLLKGFSIDGKACGGRILNRALTNTMRVVDEYTKTDDLRKEAISDRQQKTFEDTGGIFDFRY